MNIEFNKITWYSKFIAIIIYVVTLAAGIYIGFGYSDLSAKNDTPTCPAVERVEVEKVIVVSSTTEEVK